MGFCSLDCGGGDIDQRFANEVYVFIKLFYAGIIFNLFMKPSDKGMAHIGHEHWHGQRT